MQTQDFAGNIKSVENGTIDELLGKVRNELEKRETVSVTVEAQPEVGGPVANDTARAVIGKMPQYGQDITLNGLVYRVKFINKKAGGNHFAVEGEKVR